MPTVAGSVSELLTLLRGLAHIEGDRVVIEDESGFRDRGTRDLAWTATFSTDPATIDAARWIVWEASQVLDVRSASIHDLYIARASGEIHGFTVPAINIRAQTFDMARVIYETAKRDGVAALICELARSEQTYTFQRVQEFATSVLAGAMAAGWRGPVFIQGDHYQFNAAKYAGDPDAMTAEIRKACIDAIAAGYRNIDIDSSTLVDLSKPTADAQQRENYRRAAELTAVIRETEPDNITVSVGGEIGEVGKKNSTVAEMVAYLEGYRRELDRLGAGLPGIAKAAVQTGTTHGGVPLPDGGVADVALDFEVLRELGETARRYGLAGCVQHGASTLPDALFHRFPEVETAEIHLATGFQNALFDHSAFPKDLLAEIETWCGAEAADERKAGQTEEQFLYTTRKKSIGPFKRQLWDLPSKDAILATQAEKIAFLFRELRVDGSRDMVDRFVTAAEFHRPPPDAVREAASAR